MRKLMISTRPSSIHPPTAIFLAITLVTGACAGSLGSASPSDPGAATDAAGPSASIEGTPTTTASEPPGASTPPGDAFQATVPASTSLDTQASLGTTSGPAECDPSRDVSSGPDYVPLAGLDQETIELIPDATNIAVRYVNEQNQAFDVIVSGFDAGAIEEYIGTTSVCFEAVPGATVPEVPVPVYLDAILIESAAAVSGVAVETLAADRDALVATGADGSLAQVLTDRGTDPGEVLAMAIDQANTEIAAAVVDGRITQANAGSTDAAALLDQMLAFPGAPFLLDPALLAQSDADWTAILARDPQRSLVVSFRSVQRPAGTTDFDVVWFALDPTINAGQYRGYRAMCGRSASVKIGAMAGNATAAFWRYSPYGSLGSVYDAAGGSTSGWLSASSGQNTSWDVGVTGGRDNSNYTLYGGWVEGTGGLC